MVHDGPVQQFVQLEYKLHAHRHAQTLATNVWFQQA